MRRFVFPGLVAAVAVALLALLAFGVSSQGENTSIDNAVARGDYPQAPNVHMKLPILGSRGSESLASLRGKVLVVNVFASWCVPCRAEAPLLDREQNVLVRHDGTVVGVTYLDNSSDSESFVRQEHIDYLVLRDATGNFVRGFGTNGVPETFVIDRAGRVVAVRRYQLAGDWLARTVQRVLSS
jgi:cytochrome c biogenesis protein CcmG/thiol:disulfide interchange protein DsbE